MAGLLDDYFNSNTFKGQSPDGLLAMLTQMAQASPGPSQGFAAPPGATPPGGGAMMPLPAPPPSTQMSDAGGGPMMPVPSYPMGPFQPGPDEPTPVKTVMGTVADRPIGVPADAQGSAGTVYMPGPRAEVPTEEHPLLRVGRHILQRLADNSNSLIAGGGAMISGGLGHGLSAMAAASPLDIAARHERQGNQAIQATYDAVLQQQLAKGVHPAEARATALAASQNPEILKTAIGPQYQHVEIKGPLGDTQVGAFDPRTGKVTVGGQAGGVGGGGPSAYAPGVTYNPNLVGDEFKAQFSPEVQAIMEAYRRGDIMPTGNPRTQGLLPFAKIAATKWLNDIGEPASDADYARKRALQVSLAGSGPSSMGGILSNGKSAFGHLATVGEKMVELGNATGSSIPGSGNVIAGYNYLGNVLAPSSDTKEHLKNIRGAAGHYGQEATKFYAGTGGGEAERMAAAKNVAPETSSGKEMAGFLETEKELMVERFRQKENQIRQDLGEDFLQKHPVKTPDYHEALGRIDKAIAQLRGEKGAGETAPAVPTATGPKGQKLYLRDGKWVPQ